jgi:hypothetical protein
MLAVSMGTSMKHVVQLRADIGTRCEHCEAVGIESFTSSVNHYIEAHGYSLLRVGTQSVTDPKGKIVHTTVAILGSDNPPPKKPPVEIRFSSRDEKP